MRRYIVNILAAAATAAALAGCGGTGEGGRHHHEEEGETAQHEHGGGSAGSEIVLTAERAKAAGVETEPARRGEFAGVMRVPGRVMPATGEEATVVATVAGIVNLSGRCVTGSAVGKGSVVATIRTSSLGEGDASRRAAIEYERARAEYERAESLIPDRLITMAEYNAIRAEYERARMAYEAVGSTKGSGGVSVTSPISGYIKELTAVEGEYVEVGQPLMTISSNRRLQLRADVPERDYGAIRNVTTARFTTTAGGEKIYDLTELGGRLAAVGQAGQAGSSTIPVTFELDNSGDILAGSYAEVYLLTSPESDVVSVPVGALTEEQGLYFVYIKLDDDCYRKQEVKPGRRDGKRVEILTGLTGGEEIVSLGAMQIRLASASNVIPGHTHNH